MRYDSTTAVTSYLDNDLGLVVEGSVSAIGSGIPTTASKFAIGCKIVDLSTGIAYINTGTVAVPVWSRGGSTAAVDPQLLQLATVAITAAAMIDTTAAIGMSSTNGLTIVPAAPTGYVNVWHRTIVSYTFGTAAYTGGGNTTVNIGAGGAALSGLIATTSLWQSASSVIYEFKPLTTVATPTTGDVPLFVEHCEAVAAEVDVTRRWLGEQGRLELRFSSDVLPERHGALVVACAPSVGGSLLLLPA